MEDGRLAGHGGASSPSPDQFHGRSGGFLGPRPGVSGGSRVENFNTDESLVTWSIEDESLVTLGSWWFIFSSDLCS